MTDLAALDALAQADLVRRREVSALELVEEAIARIEGLNPVLNAVVTPMYELARRTAQAPLPDGPLAGVPYLLKDLGATFGGVRHTCGSRFLAAHVAERDSELVLRIKRAGLIVVGKTNTPEFGNASTTEPVLFGPCRNPWQLDRTAGGSSGGSAAAVAAGLVPTAHANDGGGSIRIPASCCGVFGLKPTRGRVSPAPRGEGLAGLACEHAVTRSVRDSAALLDVTSGPTAGDPYFAPPPSRPFLDEVGVAPGQLRIAWSAAAPNGAPVHADCAHAVEEAASLLLDLGHEVEEASPTIDVQVLDRVFFTIWTVSTAAEIDNWAEHVGTVPSEAAIEPVSWKLQEWGREFSAVECARALTDLTRLSRQIVSFFERYDAWLTPTLAQPPIQLGTLDVLAQEVNKLFQIDAAFTPWTPLANLTGQPAASIPFCWTNENLPVGIHFTTRFADEATLIRLASQLEEIRPWRDRWPQINALTTAAQSSG
jgi:amidase